MLDYKIINAKGKDIDLIISMKLDTMLDDEMDKKLSQKEKEKIENNIIINVKQNISNYKVICVEDNIAGAYLLYEYEDGFMIDELYILPEFRNNEIGTNIVNDLKETNAKLFVWVYKHNFRALKFFEKLGFEKHSNSGKTIILSFDSIKEIVLNKLNNISLGYKDKNGCCYMSPQENFRKEYHLQSPKDVLDSKVGLCFDQVELERDLISKMNVDSRSYIMTYSDDQYEMAHAFLVYKIANKYYWIEHSWVKYRGIHEYETKDELLKDISKKYINIIDNGKMKKLNMYQYKKPKFGINYIRFLKNCFNGIEIDVSKIS